MEKGEKGWFSWFMKEQGKAVEEKERERARREVAMKICTAMLSDSAKGTPTP